MNLRFRPESKEQVVRVLDFVTSASLKISIRVHFPNEMWKETNFPYSTSIHL